MTTRPPDPDARRTTRPFDDAVLARMEGVLDGFDDDDLPFTTSLVRRLVARVRALEADRRRLALLNENAIIVKVGGSYPQGPGVTALDTTWSAYVPLGQTEPEDGPLVAWIDALITSQSAPSKMQSGDVP